MGTFGTVLAAAVDVAIVLVLDAVAARRGGAAIVVALIALAIGRAQAHLPVVAAGGAGAAAVHVGLAVVELAVGAGGGPPVATRVAGRPEIGCAAGGEIRGAEGVAAITEEAVAAGPG